MTAQQIQHGFGRLRQVAGLLPTRLRAALERLPQQEQAEIEELRLRAGQAITAVVPAGERTVPGAEEPVRPEELSLVLEVATRASAHTALERVQNGFVTVRGGHRIGLCGTAVIRDGTVHNLRCLSSLCIRVARAVPGVSAPVLGAVRVERGLVSTLILSPPGGGKTTLLRDLIRAISDGEGGPPLRVGVADERSELAALWEGVPQLEVGRHTDVLEGCPKAAALMMLLRGMDPQVLAVDEIPPPPMWRRWKWRPTVVWRSWRLPTRRVWQDLRRRPLYRRLLETEVFEQAVCIRRTEQGRRYEVLPLVCGEEGPC